MIEQVRDGTTRATSVALLPRETGDVTRTSRAVVVAAGDAATVVTMIPAATENRTANLSLMVPSS